jgi:hypothetical protein
VKEREATKREKGILDRKIDRSRNRDRKRDRNKFYYIGQKEVYKPRLQC